MVFLAKWSTNGDFSTSMWVYVASDLKKKLEIWDVRTSASLDLGFQINSIGVSQRSQVGFPMFSKDT